ncbi:DNA-directed DNA/RNA polymerase mu isoform X2 [Alosa sapidissima]|uniref:DNA-directed DNA/RNA polymerase mu isoform X2 n=1 Tax=Alosa sapidissima TaxID=34773 RepID=UPI001C0A0D10|nr:DNA-directed DNA/RNA polymerase mu isoform X2 [Alosa sapidissima]
MLFLSVPCRTASQMVPLKRRKVVSTSSVTDTDIKATKYPDTVIFILERKMGASRRTFLSLLGRNKGFQVTEQFSEAVTHVVAENNSGDEVQAWLETQTVSRTTANVVHLLNISWYTESMATGKPESIQEKHKLKMSHTPSPVISAVSAKSYACQRRTPLKHHNLFLTEPLELLAENAELGENEGRSVAFRRAAAILKTLPLAVKRMEDLQGLPCLGDHSLRVVKEILEYGSSQEVESTRHSEQFQAMKALTGIFGVGVKTADRWFREGLRCPADVAKSEQRLNSSQQAGLLHHEDLSQHVSRAEADAIGQIVERAVQEVLPGAQITLIGGFRRGKETGHDVDFLITHPEEGKEEGLMPKVVQWLETQDLLLYQKTTRNSYLESKEGPARPPNNMDRFERCFSIFKLERRDSGEAHSSAQATEGEPGGGEGRAPGPEPLPQRRPAGWKAVRVDLVVSPFSQFGFALLGWTGSKLFERELRRWAGREKNMSLSSHALYDNSKGCYLRASTEEEIFSHLGLDYIPPCDRNA